MFILKNRLSTDQRSGQPNSLAAASVSAKNLGWGKGDPPNLK